jgi:hypothetical protein
MIQRATEKVSKELGEQATAEMHRILENLPDPPP